MDKQLYVEFSHVYKKFGRVDALVDVSFHVCRGIYGFLGPNGAGKTTSINLMCGFIKPNSGRIRVFGLDPWKDRDVIMSRMSVMPDEVVLPPDLTGYKILLHEARLFGLNNPEKRVFEITRRLKIDWALGRYVGGYSAGMYKRLLLSRVLINPNAELIVLDEPFSNIDVYTMLDFIRLIRELSTEGKTFLISSHIFPLITNLCDRYIFLNKGRVMFQGDFDDLKSILKEVRYLIRVRGLVDEFVDEIKRYCGSESVEVEDNSIIIHTRENKDFIRFVVEEGSRYGVEIHEIRIEPDLITQAFMGVMGTED